MLDKYDVCGLCEPMLYVLYEDLHMLDNNFGPKHVVRLDPDISAAWTSLIATVDSKLQGCYVGEVYESMLLMVTEKQSANPSMDCDKN